MVAERKVNRERKKPSSGVRTQNRENRMGKDTLSLKQIDPYRWEIPRQAFASVFGRKARAKDMPLVYDVCHNIAKMEEYEINGEMQRVCVHRKGATRAFPAGH